MDNTTRIKYLRIALIVIGLILVLAIYPLMIVWPSGWRWLPYQQHYEQMIVVIYATLGIFLIIAAKNPLEHLSLIWFTVWSSVAHGGLMLIQSLMYPHEKGHLMGDIPGLLLIAAILAMVTPRRRQLDRLQPKH